MYTLVSHLPLPAAVFDALSGALEFANDLWCNTPELIALSGSVSARNADRTFMTPALDAATTTDQRLRDKVYAAKKYGPQAMGVALSVGGRLHSATLSLTPIFKPSSARAQDGLSSVVAWVNDRHPSLNHENSRISDAMRRFGGGLSMPLAYVDEAGVYQYVSPQALALLGPDADGVVGKHFEAWSDDRPGRSVGAENIRCALNGEQQSYDRLRYDYRFLAERWNRVEMTPDIDASGRVIGVFVTSHDVHERKSAEALARSAQNQLDLHLKRGPLIAIELNEDLRIVSWSLKAEQLLGYSASEAIGKTPRELGTIPEIDSVEPQLKALVAQKHQHAWRYRNANRTKSGETIWIDWFDSVVCDDATGRSSVLCIGVDVTKELALKERLTVVATHDALTGMLNRKALTMLIESKIKSETRFALMLLDIDSFKQINDYRGHATGDQLLVAVANRIRHLLEPGERVARFGGDEFAVLLNLPEAPWEDALHERATIVLQYISEPFKIDFEFSMTASAGIVVAPGANADTDTDANTLILHADIAMYRAKAQGRNCAVLYSKTVGDDERKRFANREALRAVIRQQALGVHYQPVFDTATDRIVGAEALARWTHEDQAMLPEYFIKLAEESGFIHELWRCVMRQACEFAVQINGPGKSTCAIAVNVSPLQLKDAYFDRHVVKILRETCCLPGWISLEVTESASLGEDASAATLRKLATQGVRCSVDDFGTGYSNFAHLKRLPIATLKIDKTFVRDISSGDSSIVNSIIAMAHGLDLRVVAEGVEYLEELVELKRMGCDYYQGFISSEPIPAAELAALLAADRALHTLREAVTI